MFHWNEMLTWWLPGCNATDCMLVSDFYDTLMRNNKKPERVVFLDKNKPQNSL